MQNFEKPLHEFTEEELQKKVNQWDPRFGALALYELQRRQQKKNAAQISTLVKEVETLKDITKTNAEISKLNSKSSNKIAVAAFFVGSLSLLIAAFQMRIIYNHECWYTGAVEAKNQTERCESYLRIGAYEFSWGDKDYHAVQY